MQRVPLVPILYGKRHTSWSCAGNESSTGIWPVDIDVVSSAIFTYAVHKSEQAQKRRSEKTKNDVRPRHYMHTAYPFNPSSV